MDNTKYIELAGYLVMIFEECQNKAHPAEYTHDLIANILQIHTTIKEDEGFVSIEKILDDLMFGEE